MAVEVLAGLEFVQRAAIGALGLAAVRHVEINLGMAVPDFHVGQWAGTKHTALVIQVFGQEFNNRFHKFLNQLGTELVRFA